MAIFLTSDNKVVVQGITGSEATKHTARMLKAGTHIVGGFNARKAGDYQGGLSASAGALKACGNAHQLDPCGYALYEVGAAGVAVAIEGISAL